MPAEIALDGLSLPEKLKLMEALWEDISRKPEDVPSPEWHKEVLSECRRKAETGEEKFTDWEKAKDEIRKQVS